MPNDKRTKRIEKREDKRSKFKNPEPIDNQQIADLNQKVGDANVESPTNDTRAPRTAEGFKIAPVGGIKDRKTKKSSTSNKPTNQNQSVASVVSNINIPNDIKEDGVDYVPLEYKNSFNDEIHGGGLDSKGYSTTSRGQLTNAITRVDDPTDQRSLQQIADELEASKNFNAVLSDEQIKAQQLQYALDPDPQKAEEISKLDRPSINKINNIPNISTSDIANETQAIVRDSEVGDLDAQNKLENMFNQINRTPINYGDPALERLGLQDYYPDINMPLQVGTYSGSIVGNNPIFVAGGGVIPVGIIDARKRALERAATERVKRGEKMKELMLVPSAEQYQDKLHEMGLNIFNEYGEKVNWDYNKLTDMNNPEAREFQKEYQNYRALAARSLAINTQYDEVMKTWTSSEKYIPPEVMEAMTRWQEGSWSLDELMDSKELEYIERIMQSYDNMTKDAELLSKDIQKDKSFFGDVKIPENEEEWMQYDEEMKVIRSTKDYDLLRTGTFEYVPVDRIFRLVETKVNNKNYYNPEQTKGSMFQYLNDLISTEIMPDYHKESKGAKNRITINNNMPKDVTQSNESRILGNQDSWKNGLASSMPLGDAAVAIEMEKNLSIKPNTDENGKFKNGEIRGSYALTRAQNNEVHNYSVNEAKFIPYGTNEQLTLGQFQQKIISKFNLNVDFKDLVNKRLSEGVSDDEFYIKLVNGYEGISFNPEDAWVLSRSENSTMSTNWKTKDYVQKYKDENGNWHALKTSDDPALSAGSVPFNEISAGVIDESYGNGKFAGFSVAIDYNLTNALGDLPASDTQNVDASAVMGKENKQNNMSAVNRVNGTGDNSSNSSPVNGSGVTEL